jgi:hypothetical protein
VVCVTESRRSKVTMMDIEESGTRGEDLRAGDFGGPLSGMS